MLSYLEFLNKHLTIPSGVIIVIVGLFLVMQIVGEQIGVCGKTAPAIQSVRKWFSKNKADKDAIRKAMETLPRVEAMLESIEKHYSEDNISMRDGWMKSVNESVAEGKEHWKELSKIVLDLQIEMKRNKIIEFASRVIDPTCMATREEFNRVFKIYEEYEEIIRQNDLTNGEVDIAIRIIREAYEERLRSHGFVEDMKGY